MEPYKIQRWDQVNEGGLSEAQLEQYVPPEVESIARQVMSLYDMNVSSMTLITSKPDKGGAIWRIDTDKGPRSLKVLHREPARSLFSIGAQQYLVQQGARVPALIPTEEGQLYVEAGGKLWIVTDWIEPLQPVSKVELEGAEALCFGLGEFHRWSKGYVPPEGVRHSSRLYKWPAQYQKVIAKFGWFRDLAGMMREKPSAQRMLSVVERFDKEAREVLQRLQHSAYSRMAGMGGPYWGLAHQDYGWSNGQMGPGGIWVIDLDGVAYDFPIRDLRKLITSTMDDMGTWDIAWIRGVISAYHRANPLDRETYELLLTDMAFPNEFYKHVKEIVFDPVHFLDVEFDPIIDRILTTEETKWTVMDELARESEMYAPGDYSAASDIDPFHRPTALMRGGTVREIAQGVEQVGAEPVMEAVSESVLLADEAEHSGEAPVQTVEPVQPVVAAPAVPAAEPAAGTVPPPFITVTWPTQVRVVRRRRKKVPIRIRKKRKGLKKPAKTLKPVKKKLRAIKRRVVYKIKGGIARKVRSSRKTAVKRGLANRAAGRRKLSERRVPSRKGRTVN